jgi:hypothetical protein
MYFDALAFVTMTTCGETSAGTGFPSATSSAIATIGTPHAVNTGLPSTATIGSPLAIDLM